MEADLHTGSKPPGLDASAVKAVHDGDGRRIVIAIDLDAFYVAASRIRDPSLVDLPVAIKQKSICATTSYEARARGVNKLMRIRDAVARCPDLVLVDGEDLSYFRKTSQRIFRLISGLVRDGLVEKLGMDELFCDVTSMVDDLHAELCREPERLGHLLEPFGHVLPARTADLIHDRRYDLLHLDITTQRLLLATHIARQLRESIAEHTGLTASAGIATSKCLAKLVGNMNKPNQQTLLAPCDPHFAASDIQSLLDPLPIRKINGFGTSITAKMGEAAAKVAGDETWTAAPETMTVLVARTLFDHASLETMLGGRLAQRLWGLLHGIDDEPVVKAPDFPAQISIEDSYFGLPMEAVPAQLVKLGDSLLRRLELELLSPMDRPPGVEPKVIEEVPMIEVPLDVFGKPVINPDDALIHIRRYPEPEEASNGQAHRATWLRYPLSVRLTTRQGYTNRISRQARMPVEIFDVTRPRMERAQVLMQSCMALFRAMIQFEGNKGLGIHILNIAAIDLSPDRPDRSIGGYFHRAAAQGSVDIKGSQQAVQEATSSMPPVDLAFLMELPLDIRAEVAAEYGIVLPAVMDEASPAKKAPFLPPHLSQSSSSSTRSKSGSRSLLVCAQCDRPMSIWLQHDHGRWPDTGLPDSQTDDDEDTIEWSEGEPDEDAVEGIADHVD